MTILYLSYIGILTAIILGGIYYYEGKIDNLKLAIFDYKRALNLSKNNDHYTFLQLRNKQLKNDIRDLSYANDHLQAENKRLRKDNNELLNGGGLMQYESSVWNNAQWQSNSEYIQEDIDFEQ